MTDIESDHGDAGDPAALDLTPRPTQKAAATGPRRLLPMALLGVVVVALGFVLLQTLGNAALFFYNADEAAERRVELEGERFRVQGTPFGSPVSVQNNGASGEGVAVVFPIRFDGRVIDVMHVGSPAELFQPGVPVVLEGTWVHDAPAGVDTVVDGANDGWHFASTDMVVKHDNEYRTDNEERLDDAERGGFSPDS